MLGYRLLLKMSKLPTVDKSIQQLLKAVGSDIIKAVKAVKSWKRRTSTKNTFSMDIFLTMKGAGLNPIGKDFCWWPP